MSTKVDCNKCTHFEKCYNLHIKYGIKTYVVGLVDCDNYEEEDGEKRLDH